MKRASVFFFCSFFICLLVSAASVQAGGFALYEWGNRALGMGTATYATGNDASVVAYNPAQMTRLKGTNVYAGVTAVSPNADVYIDGEGTSLSSQIFPVPHGFVTHQLNDDWYIGFGAYTRFGLGTKYDEDWPGSTLFKEALLESVSFTPTVAYKVTDKLSVAASIEFIKGSFKVRRSFPGAPGRLSTIKTDVSGNALSGNLGLMYEFNDMFTASFMYRAPVHFSGTGGASTSGVIPNTNTSAEMRADFPSSYTLGLGVKPMENLTLEFDVIMTEWDHFDRIEFDFGPGILPDTDEYFYYKNAWRFQLGAEYLLSDNWAVRAGYVYDQTPTKHNYASPMLPANDRNMFTLGAGYKVNDWTFDWSAMYIITKQRTDMHMVDSGGNPYNVDFKNGRTWGAGMSIGYSF